MLCGKSTARSVWKNGESVVDYVGMGLAKGCAASKPPLKAEGSSI